MHNLMKTLAVLVLVLSTTVGAATATHANVGSIGHQDGVDLAAVFPVDIAPEKLPPIRTGSGGENGDTGTLARSPWIGHQGKFRNR